MLISTRKKKGGYVWHVIKVLYRKVIMFMSGHVLVLCTLLAVSNNSDSTTRQAMYIQRNIKVRSCNHC